MTIMENKITQTRNDPEYINALNEEYGRFFWKVQNIQITHLKDSRIEFEDKVYAIGVKTITETTQYATITYERDKTMPYYDELVALEAKYREIRRDLTAAESKEDWSYARPIEYSFGAKLGIGIGIVYLACGMLAMSGGGVEEGATLAGVIIGALALIVGSAVYGSKRKKAETAERDKEQTEAVSIRKQIEMKMESIDTQVNVLRRKIMREMGI